MPRRCLDCCRMRDGVKTAPEFAPPVAASRHGHAYPYGTLVSVKAPCRVAVEPAMVAT